MRTPLPAFARRTPAAPLGAFLGALLTSAAWAAAPTTPSAAAPAASAASVAAPLRLPDPAVAAKAGPAQRQVTVAEPHLSRPGQPPVHVRYSGWPARLFLDRWLGQGWDQGAGDVELEFRARDGFVSRVPVERFLRHQAWIVTARADGRPFQVDNHAQGEQQVPLGPYYLIWDNLAEPALQAEGGAVWPYQVVSLRRTPSSRAALLPGDMAPRYAAQAQALQTHCLSCHQVNGYGGDKMSLNLALRAREIDAKRWQQWLLQPAQLKPGTTMPPLSEGLPQSEREALAQQLHDYLKALPVQP